MLSPLFALILALGAHLHTVQASPDVVEQTDYFPGTSIPQFVARHANQELNDYSKSKPAPPPEARKDPDTKYHQAHDTNPEDPKKGYLIAMDSKGRRVRIDKANRGTIPLEYILDHSLGKSRSKAYATQPEMCDACKTMVEELHMVLHPKRVTVPETSMEGPLYHQVFAEESLATVDSVCTSSRYQNYASHIREGCEYMLHGERRQEVLRVLDNVHPIHTEHGTHADGLGYAPKHCVWRRRVICEEIFGVCPQAPPPTFFADECRTCAEVFTDFHYLQRREHVPIDDETAARKNRMEIQLNSLCTDVEMRHSFSIAEHLNETCSELVVPNVQKIVDVYLRPSEENPARFMCVDVTKSCSRKSWAVHAAHCEHAHDFARRTHIHEKAVHDDYMDDL